MKMKRSVVYGPTLLTLFLFSFTLLIGCGGEPELNKITISPEQKTITIGETIEFTAEAVSKDDEPMPEAKVNWYLEPTDRGSIASTGVFTPQKPGEVIVKASSKDVVGQARVLIQAKEVAAINVKPETDKGLPGSKLTVAGNLMAADKTPAGFNTVAVSPATEGTQLVAETIDVSEKGTFSFEVTLKAEPGPNTILLESGKIKTELVLQGTRIVKLAIRPEEDTFEVNEEVAFEAVGFDKYGNSRPLEVKWSLSGNKARLKKEGQVTMLGVGEAVLIADYKELSQGRPFTIVPGKLANISLHPEKISLQAGQSAYIKITGRNQHGHILPVKASWSLSADLGNIDPDGLFVAKKVGSGSISARAGEVSSSIPVEVKPGYLADIELKVEKTRLAAGQSLDLGAQGFDAFGNPIRVDPAWSLDQALGRIDQEKSVLKVYQSGTGEIRAQQGNILKAVKIEVSPAELNRLQILPANPTVPAGSEIQFKVQGFDRFNNPVSIDPALELQDKLGDLQKDGGFTAQQAGNTVLTAKQGEVVTSTSLAVVPDKMVQAVLTPDTPVVLKAGEVEEFTVFGLDKLDNTVHSRTTWTLSPSDLGTVDSQGVVTGKKTGEGTLLAEITDLKTGEVLQVENSVKVKPGEPVRIEIDPEEASLAAGEKRAFQTTVYDKFNNQLNTSVDWSLESESIGTITANGIFKPVKSGEWKITAGINNVRAQAAALVVPNEIAYNNVTPAALSLKAGETQKLEAVSEDKFGNVIPSEVVWKVIPEKLGSVTKENIFLAQKKGQGYLTAVANDIAQKLPLEVTTGPLSEISITAPQDKVPSGETVTLQAKGFDPGGNPVRVQANWSVQPEDIGRIDEQGRFTATKVGQGTITAKSQGVVDMVSIETVPGRAATIKVKNDTPLELIAGKSIQLELEAFDRNNNQIEAPGFSFQIEDRLGTILGDNRFKAQMMGTGKIIVSSAKAKAGIPIQVKPGQVQRIEVKPARATVSSGSELEFTAAAFDQEGNPVALDPSWTVIGGIGSVSENGTFTAHTVGQGHVSCQMAGVAGLSPVSVEPGPVAGIEVRPEQTRLTAGESGQFQATAYDAQGNMVEMDPTWSLPDGKELGVIDQDGTLRAQKAGQLQIRATMESIQGQAMAEIIPAEISELILDRQKLELVSGKTTGLKVKGQDPHGNLIQIDPSWSVRPKALATIDPSGQLTAQKAGSGIITAHKGDFTASMKLSVSPGQLDAIQIQPLDEEALLAGTTYQFTATGLDKGGNEVQLSPNWAVTTHIGNIDRKTGTFRATKVGSGSVEAYFQGIVASMDIEVVPGNLNQLFIDPNPVTVKSGQNQTFTVKGMDSEKNTVRVPELEWTVHGNIGFFSNPAEFTATNRGSGKIAAQTNGLTAKSYVNVVAGVPDMDKTRVRAEQATVQADGQSRARIIIEVRDKQNNLVPEARVKLVSSRRGDQLRQPAPSDTQGRTSGAVTSQNKGTSTITALINQDAVRDTVVINFR